MERTVKIPCGGAQSLADILVCGTDLPGREAIIRREQIITYADLADR
jgi:hypothetical protein